MPFGPARQAASSRNRRSFRWSGRYRERSGGHGRGLGCRGRARPGRVPPCLRNCGDLRFGNGVAVVLGTAVRNSLLRSETARSDGRVPDFRRHSVTPGEKSEAVRCQRRRREGKPRRVSFRPRGDLLRDVVGPLRARGGRCPPSRRRGGPAGAGERAVRPPLARCGTSPQAEGHRLSREILISRPDRPPPDRPDRHRAPVSSLRSLSLHSSVPPHRANHSEPGGTRAEGTRSTRSASRSSSGFPMYSALPARKNGQRGRSDDLLERWALPRGYRGRPVRASLTPLASGQIRRLAQAPSGLLSGALSGNPRKRRGGRAPMGPSDRGHPWTGDPPRPAQRVDSKE